MFLVIESEMPHSRKLLAEQIRNFCHGRHLPVEVPAVDKYAKRIHPELTRIDSHTNILAKELECGAFRSEVLCRIYKLWETWDGKCELAEEVNIKLREAGGGDPVNKCIQVSANTTEQEMVKVRKCDGRDDRRMRELPLYAAVGNREFEVN